MPCRKSKCHIIRFAKLKTAKKRCQRSCIKKLEDIKVLEANYSFMFYRMEGSMFTVTCAACALSQVNSASPIPTTTVPLFAQY